VSQSSAANSPPSADTREALLRAGLDLFGSKGFEATSTREIAAAAKANVASIAYHFGGKAGLRSACAARIAETIAGLVGPILAAGDGSALSPVEAEALLVRAVETMIGFIVARAEAQPVVRFVLREQMEQSPGFDLIHDRMMAPMHERVCRLWGQATGMDPDSDETRLATLSVIGQVLYFRIARFVVLRRMGWSDIGPREAAQIAKAVTSTLRAALAAARKEGA
jgi:TetR/AcrR family transcriptional regulator, regulator of cefoperazone and chloramphenicol sensitivity